MMLPDVRCTCTLCGAENVIRDLRGRIRGVRWTLCIPCSNVYRAVDDLRRASMRDDLKAYGSAAREVFGDE